MCAKPISAAEGGRWVHACRIDAFAGRAIVPVFVAGHHLVLVQDDDGIFAAERACPHEGADLALGHCSGGRLFCPRHRAWFALANGAVSAGWYFRDLRTYPTRREGSGIQVLIDVR
ncbi:Rieske 2Fe-2S domain-containing protein [Methylobacterium sp. 10]|uniref:Rieske (2Fe-2S) protein n=1 Tax=Methylobacterium sp. 10 TaxID=1101191 RepID=UPI00047FF9A9|nr:Rieske 2Fe-2S domain-containing protein [Methylobacterium sp. 10]